MAYENFPEGLHAAVVQNDYLCRNPISRSMWHWIAKRYSGCCLAKSYDKLVAISGTVRRVGNQGTICCRFMAGGHGTLAVLEHQV